MTVTEDIKQAVGLGDGGTFAMINNFKTSTFVLTNIAAPASREAMSDAKVPLAYRDSCAHLLIPLNQCRHREYWLPWKCENERHSYEKCQYEEFKKRVAKMDEIRAAKGTRSN